jgi:hypothetical protein
MFVIGVLMLAAMFAQGLLAYELSKCIDCPVCRLKGLTDMEKNLAHQN